MPESNDHLKCLVAIRLRGTVRISPELQKALESLRLKAKYNAVLIPDTPGVKGTLQKAKDHITWGGVDSETIAQLLKMRGRIIGNFRIDDEYIRKEFSKYDSVNELAEAVASKKVSLDELWKAGIKPVFRLHPPKGGFKYSIKRQFKTEGELGYRGSEIKPLLERMI